MEDGWYVRSEGPDAVGPVTTELLIEGVRAGRVPITSLVCPVGGSEWLPLIEFTRLALAIREALPPPPFVEPAPPVAPNVSSQVVFKREEERSGAMPITYREYVYLVPEGTSEAGAGAFLLAQLEEVKTSLGALPPGQLVNLAVVDAPPSGKPALPLVALTWKDWRTDVTLTSPRRPAAEPARAQPDLPIELVTRSRSSIRLRDDAGGFGDDRIADVFEAMNGLHFLADAIDAGAFCLGVAMDRIPSTVGLVHVYDAPRSEFVAANARGDGADALLSTRRPESDPVIAICRREFRALVVEDDAALREADRAIPGGAARALVAPLTPAGRFMGAIELLNPSAGQSFDESDANVLAYVAAQLSEFIARHGVVTDAGRILRPQGLGSRRAAR